MIRLTLAPADELARQLDDAKLGSYTRERALITGRNYRADFCWPGHRLVVEVDGGTWSRQGGKRCPLCGQIPVGRHGTGSGRETDCEKFNLTTLAGWRVLVVTTHQVRDGRALDWIRQALSG